jgi:chromosome segregation ATPase
MRPSCSPLSIQLEVIKAQFKTTSEWTAALWELSVHNKHEKQSVQEERERHKQLLAVVLGLLAGRTLELASERESIAAMNEPAHGFCAERDEERTALQDAMLALETKHKQEVTTLKEEKSTLETTLATLQNAKSTLDEKHTTLEKEKSTLETDLKRLREEQK